MHKGSKEIKCAKGATILIRASGTFCAYAMEASKRTLILGPLTSTARALKYKLPPDIEKVFVKAEKSTEWTIEWSYYNPSEISDPIPVELPIGFQQPESLASQMRRMIKNEVSRAAEEQGFGSFQDEDDFELDEEILTNYEMTDMEEMQEYEQELEPVDPAKKDEVPIDEVDENNPAPPPEEQKTVDSAT